MKYIKKFQSILERIDSGLFKELGEINYILEDDGCQVEIVSAVSGFHNRFCPIGYNDTDHFVLVRFPKIVGDPSSNATHIVNNFFDSDIYTEWFDRSEEICDNYKYVLEKIEISNTHDNRGISLQSYNYEQFIIAILYTEETAWPRELDEKLVESKNTLGDDPEEFIKMVFDEDEFKEEFPDLELVQFNKQHNLDELGWSYDITGLAYDSGICLMSPLCAMHSNLTGDVMPSTWYNWPSFKYDTVYDYLKEKIDFLKESNIEVVYQVFTPNYKKGIRLSRKSCYNFVNLEDFYLSDSKGGRVKNPELYEISLYLKQN